MFERRLWCQFTSTRLKTSITKKGESSKNKVLTQRILDTNWLAKSLDSSPIQFCKDPHVSPTPKISKPQQPYSPFYIIIFAEQVTKSIPQKQKWREVKHKPVATALHSWDISLLPIHLTLFSSNYSKPLISKDNKILSLLL